MDPTHRLGRDRRKWGAFSPEVSCLGTPVLSAHSRPQRKNTNKPSLIAII